jgi:two-component system sensor histidine kinase RegB
MSNAAAISLPNRDDPRMNFSWLVRLRWGAVVGQVLVIAFVHRGMEVPLPIVPLSGLVLTALVLNVLSSLWAHRARAIRESHLALSMALDLLLFSAILYFTGGPSNPFSSLYLIHIALAAVVLPPRWSWTLVGFALACSLALFFAHEPLANPHRHHHDHTGQGGFDWHLRGMWVALGVAASFIVYFLHRVTRALRERDGALALERERTLRHERVATVATLAAGAAHELASPLGTIAVASGELEAALRGTGVPEPVLADLVLIREQVARCRKILDQLAADSGQASGETFAAIEAHALADLALENLEGRERVDVRAPPPPDSTLFGPPRALVQAVRSLLENALRATDASGRVDLEFVCARDAVRIQVVDRGVGMSPEVLERAAEPFFSTRGTGRGMGLGLFLARSIADQLGGRLDLASQPGAGTRAALVLPLSLAHRGVR